MLDAGSPFVDFILCFIASMFIVSVFKYRRSKAYKDNKASKNPIKGFGKWTYVIILVFLLIFLQANHVNIVRFERVPNELTGGYY